MQRFLDGNPTFNALVVAMTAVIMLVVSYTVLEPVVVQGGDMASSTFTVRQQITGEIAFTSPPGNVTMAPSIPGLTGGTALGSSTFAISTNNPSGYNVTIKFASSTAMEEELGSAYINNYSPSTSGVPDYNFTIGGAGTPGEFGFTINTIDPDDADSRFNNSGVTCNTGTANDADACWYGASDATSPVGIIDAAGPTIPTGATSTLVFQIQVPANPSPALPTGFYTATATLTATENP